MAGLSKGAAGEMLAARFLRQKGYTIVAANFRCRLGEVDIIASDRQYIAFVEVKTRTEGSLYSPREAVTVAKQRKLIQTAALFLKSHPEIQKQPRFDVIEVVTKPGNVMEVAEIDHILNAYEAGDLHAAF